MKPSFTIGIEEEYQTVDPATYDLRSHVHTEILAQGKRVMEERVRAELHQSVVEVGTGVCRNIKDAATDLRGLRRQMIALAKDNGLTLVAGATHPFADWRTQEISPDARYVKVVEDLQLVARANLIFGLHVHIGIEDRETCIHLMNQARYFLPHLLALSTNSPFWLGMNTGLKSYRTKVFDKFPRTNIPDAYTSWSDYENFVNLLVRTRCIDNAKRIWWDIRPHPFFTTLEFRVCDIPMRVDETLAIAALIQATVAKLYKLHSKNQSFRYYSRALLMENKWRASRYGLDGSLIDFGRETEVPERDLIHEYLEFVDDVVDELDSREEVAYIHEILKKGAGADRQLRVFEATGDLKRVVDYMAAETQIEYMNSNLLSVPFDPELVPGARNAVRVCLALQPTEKVSLITDEVCREIAASLAQQIALVAAPFNSFVLEELTERPLVGLPAEISADMETSHVSILAVQVQPGELGTRMALTEIVNRRRMRHAHMVNINRQIMMEGMRADFHKVDRISTRVLEIVSRARQVRARSAAGSDLIVDFDPRLRWLKTSGLISPNKWGNLPGGEVFTTPEQVDGIFVIDGVVGDYLCEKFGELSRQPLTVRIAGSRLVDAWSENKALENEFWQYTHTDENSDRVGEFAIGTNIELHGIIGHILQDEKFPGIHIAFGNPYGAHTGADWDSSTHIDVVGTRFDVWVDEEQIMQEGQFLIAVR